MASLNYCGGGHWPVQAGKAARRGSIRKSEDGRGDLISQGPMFDQYFQIVELKDGYKELLDQLQIQLVIMPSGSRLVTALRAGHKSGAQNSNSEAIKTGDSAGWNVLFDDQQFTLLSRRP